MSTLTPPPEGNEIESPPRKHEQLQQSKVKIEIPLAAIRELRQAAVAIGQWLISLLRWLLMIFGVVRASLHPENAPNFAILTIMILVFVLTRRRK